MIQHLCSAAKLNFPKDFGLDSNEARGAWSNNPSCVHLSLAVVACTPDLENCDASNMLTALCFAIPIPLQHR
jgi:hypothetical protein